MIRVFDIGLNTIRNLPNVNQKRHPIRELNTESILLRPFKFLKDSPLLYFSTSFLIVSALYAI